MTEISAGTIPELNYQIDQILDAGTFANWSSRMEDHFLNHFADQGKQITALFIQSGDQYYALCGKKQEDALIERQDAFFVTYHWANQAKAFLILWRDVLFELQKGQLFLQQQAIPAESLDWLHLESKTAIRKAAEELKQYLEASKKKARQRSGGINKHLRNLQLQQNPWPVYREQMQAISAQLEQLVLAYEKLDQTGNAFQRIHHALKQTLSNCRKDIEQHRQLAQQTIAIIEKDNDTKAGRIANQLEEVETEIHSSHHINEFVDFTEKTIAQLSEKLQVPIAIEGGLIRYKEINFRKGARQWLDSEMLPPLYEIWELAELNANGLKMSLLNIRNRALLLAPEQKEGKNADFDRKDLAQPLQVFLRKSTNIETDLQKLRTLVEDRLVQDFQLTHVYHPTQVFLPVPLQSTINKLRVNQNFLVTSLASSWQRLSKAFRKLRKTVEIEESLSTSEKVVRYLQSRTWETVNTHYNSLFLTKGYVGESFWVGRDDELRHFQQLIQDWKNGFRGAVAITGQRLSGKSLLGEVVANRYFPQKAIRLQPQSSIVVRGRRLETTYDLEEALIFIRKHTLNTPHLVWIDDLELWRDPNVPLGKNITTLRRFIDDYGNQLFFMVAMSNGLRHHLERFFNISKIFQAEINLDKMSLRDVREAIMIRHGATHKELLDHKTREISPKQFQQMTARVHKAAHGNIGEALNIWAFSTLTLDEDRVTHEFKTLYELPDFITPDNGLLLASIVLAKKTNEYRLRKLFGPSFSDKYRGVLQRLISIGLLHREADGWLEITESAANDLGRLLEQKHYLKFQR